MTSPTASIVVLTYNNLTLTRQCLESIFDKTNAPDFELIVVDNASTDGTPQFLRQVADVHSNVRQILNVENTGFAHGNNQGAAAATGEYLVFLNNDTVVTPGWLDGLIRYLRDPSVGMVGPVTNNSGNETRIRVDYTSLDDLGRFAEEYTHAHRGQATEIGMLPFLCVALRRVVFEEIGPLDECFGVGMFEDDDYAFRLKQKGYRLLCVEEVFVHHWGSAGFSLAGFARYWQLYQENLNKYEAKWGVKWHPHRYRTDLLDEQFDSLWQEKRSLAFQVIELGAQLAEIQNSTMWMIFNFLRRIRARIAPDGSARSRFIGLGLRVVEALILKIRAAYKVLAHWLEHCKLEFSEAVLRRRLIRELKQILVTHASAKEIVVFVPTITWNTKLFQRPQQMALAFARLGCLVIFCELPTSPHFKGEFHRIDENLYVLGKAPWDILRCIPSPIVFTLAYNKAYLANFTSPRVVYEYIDELDVFPGNLEELQRDHEELVRSADVVLATSDKLFQQIKPVRPDVRMSPNAVDEAFIIKAIRDIDVPPDELMAFVRQNRPIIGYYGALAEWFDYHLVKQVARARPDYEFILIGPDYDGSIEKSRVCEIENINWLGWKHYTELPPYLKYFDVGIIPFKLNDITHATSPLKLFEYMTAGKPIVTTAMQECQKYPEVLIAQNETDFVEKLDEALKLRFDSSYHQALTLRASQNTWDIRASAILETLSVHTDNPSMSH